jgi:hypothetical protein
MGAVEACFGGVIGSEACYWGGFLAPSIPLSVLAAAVGTSTRKA